MEKTLITSKLYSSRLIESNLDPLIIIKLDGTIIDLNQAKIKIIGIDRKLIIGTNFCDYITDKKNAYNALQQINEKEEIVDIPLTFKNKNGNLTDVLLNGLVYNDSDGKTIGAVLVARNIHEQKLAQELKDANKRLGIQNTEKEKHDAELIVANTKFEYEKEEKEKCIAELQLANYARSLIEASLDPLLTINAKGKITDMNQATLDVTGENREELTGSNFFDYFTEPQKAREVYQEVFAYGSVTNSPLILRHKDGILTDVLFNGSVYKDNNGDVLGVVVVARDITEQKIIANQLKEAIVFAENAANLAEEAKIKAENAVKSKQQFLSNMSHEIRTPMNAIIGFTKVVMKTNLGLKQKEYLNAIKLSGDSLIVLINDILDLAKVDAGKMKFEQTPFKLDTSISAMLHVFETKIQEKNIRLIKKFDNNIPKVIVGDSVRLHQIILNLISNAVKFTNKGAITVTVQLINENEENIFLEFSVSDTGIGIAKDKLNHIFENFQQASSETSRLYGGTGLGLAISKQLVESQGGTIRVDSKVAVGSTFSFILPFTKTNEDAENDTETIELDTDVKNMKVLVVEDIPLNQLLMKTLLDDFGFEFDIADNGKIAIEKLQTKSYDIILMDLQMPQLNGFEATEYIRKTMNSNIPIMALTADVTTADLQKCTDVGMNDYIAKPIDERILYGKMISLLKKPTDIENIINTENKDNNDKLKIEKCIDLTYLEDITKKDKNIMMEMISLYIKQTNDLIVIYKDSLEKNDWPRLSDAIHKSISSFCIVGIDKKYEEMAQIVQEYTISEIHLDEVISLTNQIIEISMQACKELLDFQIINKTK